MPRHTLIRLGSPSLLWLALAVALASGPAGCSRCRKDEPAKADKAPGEQPTPFVQAPDRPAIDDKRAAEIAGIQVPGFRLVKGDVVRGAAVPKYEAEVANAHGHKVWVLVNVQKCMRCEPVDLEAWRSNPGLKQMLSPAAAADPNLVLEVDPIEAAGVTAVAIYRRSYVAASEGKRQSIEHGLQVHYNNGVNQLLLEVMSSGLVTSAEELATTMTKAEMLAAARQFLEVFVPTLSDPAAGK
jgi:hypothetical protein